MEAENNMYEDLDLYDYDFMKGKDISKEIEKDVAKYVLGILNWRDFMPMIVIMKKPPVRIPPDERFFAVVFDWERRN